MAEKRRTNVWDAPPGDIDDPGGVIDDRTQSRASALLQQHAANLKRKSPRAIAKKPPPARGRAKQLLERIRRIIEQN